MGGAEEAAGVLERRLRYLVLVRLAFATFLLGAALLVRLGPGEPGGYAIHPLYGFTAAIYALSALYLTLGRWVGARALAHVQVLGDVAGVSTLIYITGGLASIFGFLYFPVIIAASALLYRGGAMLAATASALLFALVLGLQFTGYLNPPFAPPGLPNAAGLLYKLLTHAAAFYLVAGLSAYLAEEARRSAGQLSVKQQEVRRLDEFNRSVVQSMGSGLITTDERGRISSLNRAAERILAVREAQVLGTPLEALCPEMAAQLGDRAAAEPEGRHDLVFRRADGTELCLGFSVSPLLAGHEGEEAPGPVGHVLIFRDLTALRRMEERVRRAERLAAVGELAAGIAHEIKNPLASISGGVQMLQAEPEISPQNQRLLAIVSREARRLNGLVEDFLLFARPGSRPRQRLDLAAVATEALDSLRARLAPGVRLEPHIEAGLWVQAAPEEMRQLMANLLTNALEAMPDGGTLTVELRPEEEGVRLRVSDTGRGIGAEDLNRIFTPFFTRKERGTGLGLAIVHAIVERHGGRIEVASRPGQTTFTVWLPTTEAAAQLTPQAA